MNILKYVLNFVIPFVLVIIVGFVINGKSIFNYDLFAFQYTLIGFIISVQYGIFRFNKRFLFLSGSLLLLFILMVIYQFSLIGILYSLIFIILFIIYFLFVHKKLNTIKLKTIRYLVFVLFILASSFSQGVFVYFLKPAVRPLISEILKVQLIQNSIIGFILALGMDISDIIGRRIR